MKFDFEEVKPQKPLNMRTDDKHLLRLCPMTLYKHDVIFGAETVFPSSLFPHAADDQSSALLLQNYRTSSSLPSSGFTPTVIRNITQGFLPHQEVGMV